MKKNFNELNKIEKKIAIRKYTNPRSTFVFPIFISLIIIGYYLYEFVSNLFIIPLIICSLLVFIFKNKKIEKDLVNKEIELTKEDFIKYGYSFELEKKKENVSKKEKVGKNNKKRKKSNNK